MVLNRYEYSKINNSKLPESWQSQQDLDDLNEFLQRNWELRQAFFNDEDHSSKQQFLKFTGQKGISTNKYIGTIVFKGEQLNIYPRVFKSEKEDYDTEDLSQKHLMDNLIHWIEYCNKVEYPYINISSELTDADDLRELFITLYVNYVKHAIERGLYFKYVEENNDINSIKGKFNLKDYITVKVPNGKGEKFNCTYSNFEFDNDVNRIIKCTCLQLIGSTKGKNLSILRRILTRLNDVSTVQCKPNDCDSIRLSKMHRNYEIIISMSKMFLLNKMSNYTVDNNQSFCFMFPTDLLFEGFVGGFMQEVIEQQNGKVKLQKSDMSLIDEIKFEGRSLGSAFTMRHDIVVELEDKVFILDTKYKEVSRFEGDDDEVNSLIRDQLHQGDAYQVCEYARKRGVDDVYLLYPMYRYEDIEPSFPVGISNGTKGSINVHFVRLPFVFEEDESLIKERLKKVIVDILKVS